MAKEEIKEILKEIETSLNSHNQSFGLLCPMNFYSEDDAKEEISSEYLLCVAIATPCEPSVAVGYDIRILKNEEIKLTPKRLGMILDLFKKCKKEIIIDMENDLNTFSIEKYIKRINALQP